MKLLTRWAAILSLVSILWLELSLLRSEETQALPANPVLVSQTTALEYIKRATARAQTGDLQGAVADATQAIQLKPKAALAYTIRANAHNRLGNFQAALADATQAIQLKPKGAGAYAVRARARIGLDDFQEALADSNQAIQLMSKVSKGFVKQGKSRKGSGDFEGDLDDGNQAIHNRKLSDTYAVRAIARIELGDPAGGLSDAKQAIQIDPKDGEGYYVRGLARLKQGDQQGAMADYNQAMQREPSLAKELENYTKIAQSQPQDPPVAANPNMSSPQSPETQGPQKPTQSTATRFVPTPTQATQSTPDVYQIAKETTVLIDSQNPGSGVIIAKTNNVYYVLTAKHVVATADEYKIITPDRKQYTTDPNNIKRLSQVDLAIVEFTSTQAYPIARLGNSDQVKQGANVYVSGWPLPDQAITQRTHLVTKGEIAGLQPGDPEGYGFLYGNNTAPGMSGGPILDTNGQVIGIHGRAAGNQVSGKVGINLGIPINLFLRSATQAGINLQQLGLKAEN